MSDDDYTPTTEGLRSGYAGYWDAQSVVGLNAHAEFDRWLAAHDAAIRAEQREVDALIAESEVVRTGFSLKADIAAAIRAAGEQPGTETKETP